MAISKGFKLAELIRHIEYDSSDDVIKTSKATQDANTKRGSATKTATDVFNLDTFAHATCKNAFFCSCRYERLCKFLICSCRCKRLCKNIYFYMQL